MRSASEGGGPSVVELRVSHPPGGAVSALMPQVSKIPTGPDFKTPPAIGHQVQHRSKRSMSTIVQTDQFASAKQESHTQVGSVHLQVDTDARIALWSTAPSRASNVSPMIRANSVATLSSTGSNSRLASSSR